MFPEGEGNEEDRKFQYGEELEEEVTDYSHVTKHPYINKIFCWIEQGDTKQVINFFNSFPHLINEFKTPNNWNPFMYAVRYGNMELIEYFTEKKMKISVNSIFSQVSMIHSAVYSGDINILKHVVNVMKCSPNPPNAEIAPLKIAMKIGNSKMVELLICKGSYYAFGDVYNNMEPKSNSSTEDNSKYLSLLNGKDVLNNSVVQDSTIKDCPIKETLRWARIRQLMFISNYSEKQQDSDVETPFDGIKKIMNNKSHFSLILKMCIGNGDSILKRSEVNQEPKEKEDRKEGKDGRQKKQ